MKIARTLSTIMLLACAMTHADEPSSHMQQDASQLAASSCSACHGAGGRNVSPIYPNLAAQTAPYLEAQLRAFRNQTRAGPDALAYMSSSAAPLNDDMIGALAAYYSMQSAPAGRASDVNLVARGRPIFERGVPGKANAACSSCHGDLAQGNGPFPRLAGQHAAYLFKQMLVIRDALRSAPVMHGVMKDLSNEQMQAVAAYLESLGP